MTDYAAEAFSHIATREKEIAAERLKMLNYWCSCGHIGRMSFKHEDGHQVCSACAKPLME